MTASTLTRPQKAMQIERRTWKSWTPGAAAIRIPSQSKPGVLYTVTLDACDCPDFRYHSGAPVCKHCIAARIWYARQAH